ncbi:glycosyltransferase [Pseudomonas sp. SLFW]|uniref:glycosyltransferase n=1 Tax=Pseudomonas sp. SLFW TaxID=2683259 RepID=UPI001412953E|nr:glycosyltransferase [Pseudomonas sp. SLFW]NBB10448.1 glycosyltransferase [Pseudomonas sp. SLFW]
MPVKRYGIYLAYAPTVDLRNEGLGRYLANFVRGGTQSADVEFVIACPSWSRESLEDLFKSEAVSAEVSVISPSGKPYLLYAYETYRWLVLKKSAKSGGEDTLLKKLSAYRDDVEIRVSQTHSLLSTLPLIFSIARLLLLFLCLVPLVMSRSIGSRLWRMIRFTARPIFKKLENFIARVTHSPKNNEWVRLRFQSMSETENKRMKVLIEAQTDVIAWYSPTSFWPAFNELNVPKLMCVPDVVMTDFSVGFAGVGGNRFLETFNTVEKALRGAQHIVTYSQHTKWHTLVDRFCVSPPRIRVVEHAPNPLDHLIDVNGFPDALETSRTYCKNLLLSAMQRTQNVYTALFANQDVEYIFYPSQIRPNKNILTLLRAYKHLLHNRRLGLKLILTGDVYGSAALSAFIDEHRLQADVICLRGLSTSELAACYRLALLAVNPSLSEGGCPFTFSEALSVGTPAVMSRIPVTLEVLTDPILQETSLFDPYDWEDMAERIEWAIKNRAELLTSQQEAYALLSKRSWADVAREHIILLDAIARESHHGDLPQLVEETYAS